MKATRRRDPESMRWDGLRSYLALFSDTFPQKVELVAVKDCAVKDCKGWSGAHLSLRNLVVAARSRPATITAFALCSYPRSPTKSRHGNLDRNDKLLLEEMSWEARRS